MINGKMKTTYAHIYTISAEAYNKKHKNNECVMEVKDGKYAIDEQRELLLVINILNNL